MDGKNDESFAARKRKTASASVVISYEVVETDEQIEPALKKLSELGEGLPLVAVDLEGDKLNRKGKLAILSVATENDTFLFDIHKLGPGVFDKGLRDLLQDPGRQKLMFDCRQDSDCLWHQYQVKLTNVLDLQLMEVICRGDASTHQRLNLRPNKGVIRDVPRVLSFKKCLENFVKDEGLIKAKEEVQHLDGVWLSRPLHPSFLRYAAADVIGMLQFYQGMREEVEKMNAMEQLRDVSNRYVDFYRLRGDRSYDIYEGNPFLPWRIFQCTYSKNVQCTGCKRVFPSADFTKTQKLAGEQKCPVCRKVKNVEDIRKNREDNLSRVYDHDYYYSSDNDYCDYDYFFSSDNDDCDYDYYHMYSSD